MLVRALVISAVLIVACNTSPPPPAAPPPSGPAPQASGCGVALFATPACQGALDQVCCAIETDCAKDPGCARLSQCILSCRGKGDNCVNGCGMQARHDYCTAACASRGPECQPTCIQRGSPAEPMVKWGLIANCSKGVRYPSGVRCDDDS